MRTLKQLALIGFMIGAALAGTALAANVDVAGDIATSTTWTSDNVYNLVGQRYVLPGATLTIQAGTLIKTTAGSGGSLAVCRGAKIFANGTENSPVIFTSTADTMTTWREGCNEWGNLTIMGNGLISASHFGGLPVGSNTKEPTGLNQKAMEGLTAAFAGDPNVMYGGNDDNDDSGALTYVSLRYGGRVVGLGNELNGLSLGGIGRETDINHIEVMNNVDDGIEIWGGTVNLKYISIWNIGDDSLDCDQGWRGKAQFGLIVQGYSTSAAQGSGVGDNCIEIDGAEDSDAQPVTTVTISNFTVIGQPIAGDHGAAFRDNANVQYRDCIFMELGEQLIKNDNVDGDGAHGYGYNGTLSFLARWTTPYTYRSPVNAGSADPEVLYQAQSSGTLCEMTGCTFYNNPFASAYTQSNTLGVTVSGGSSPAMNNVVATTSPIQGLTRAAPVTKGGLMMLLVTYLNPCAVEAPGGSPGLDGGSAAMASDDFFTPVAYRGGFSSSHNWLGGWTAAASYGIADVSMNVQPTSGGALSRNWVYQNTPVTTGNRHMVYLSVTVTGTTDYTVAVTKDAASVGDVSIESTADPLVWIIRGSARQAGGTIGTGRVKLNVTVTDNPSSVVGAAQVEMACRPLGDIDAVGGVNGQDKLQMNKRLNGLVPDGPECDLDGIGGSNGQDKLIINKILNGLTIQ